MCNFTRILPAGVALFYGEFTLSSAAAFEAQLKLKYITYHVQHYISVCYIACVWNFVFQNIRRTKKLIFFLGMHVCEFT
jgi:hypothetical protein